jgi:hypothetical protein
VKISKGTASHAPPLAQRAAKHWTSHAQFGRDCRVYQASVETQGSIYSVGRVVIVSVLITNLHSNQSKHSFVSRVSCDSERSQRNVQWVQGATNHNAPLCPRCHVTVSVVKGMCSGFRGQPITTLLCVHCVM